MPGPGAAVSLAGGKAPGGRESGGHGPRAALRPKAGAGPCSGRRLAAWGAVPRRGVGPRQPWDAAQGCGQQPSLRGGPRPPTAAAVGAGGCWGVGPQPSFRCLKEKLNSKEKKIGRAASSVLLGGGKGTVLQASRCCGNGFLEGREVRVWVIFVVNAVRSRENATRAAPDAASSGAGGRRPPSALGMRGQLCRRAAATRVPWGAGRGSSPWLAARLPVLWPSLPGAAREIL